MDAIFVADFVIL